MSNSPYIPDDWISLITSVVEPMTKHLRRYVGEVKSIDDDGICDIHSIDYGTYDNDRDSWVQALPAIWMKSLIYPNIGDQVEFYFQDGSPDKPRWCFYDMSQFSNSFDLDKTKDIIYTDKDTIIQYNKSSQKLSIEIDGLNLIDVLGDMMSALDKLCTAIEQHKHTTPMGVSSMPDNVADIIIEKSNLESVKDDFEKMLE
jgi:hypothetical protein